ncbi:ankyrin repeat domain-containing protein [Maribacter sp. 2210JD10-5]|uniref:ankyrin repeat domain-containing protein n=1 Tax=Maribacter sp. 2210JD10-5 TaxID=3386272 RepID=UPI0039BD4439
MIEFLKDHLQNKETEKVLLMLQENPKVLEMEDKNGNSCLMLIAYSGLDEVFQKAIDLKTSFTFHEAIICGKIEKVSDYLKKSKKEIVNEYSKDGFTPLSLAAFFGRTEIAKLLVEYMADPNMAATNPSKVNALHSAVAKENYELCKMLLNNGADVNATQMQNVTALHSAVHRGNLELVKLLIENGASAQLLMDNGDTALDIAKREKHQDILDFLR